MTLIERLFPDEDHGPDQPVVETRPFIAREKRPVDENLRAFFKRSMKYDPNTGEKPTWNMQLHFAGVAIGRGVKLNHPAFTAYKNGARAVLSERVAVTRNPKPAAFTITIDSPESAETLALTQ